MLNEIITIIVGAVMSTVSAVLLGWLVPYLKSKTTVNQRIALTGLVEAAVAAAEQIFDKPGAGVKKKAFVVDWLGKHGVNQDDVNELIEAAVYALKHE